MNSGFQAGQDYLQIWHAYLDYLRRYFVSETCSSSATANKEELIEEIRESFQKAIDQLYNCKSWQNLIPGSGYWYRGADGVR